MSIDQKTQDAYLRRALWFESRVLNETKNDEITPIDVAKYAIEKRLEWSASNWRQVKSSLIFRYENMKTEEALDAIRLLRDAKQDVCLKNTGRTSALRKKNFSNKELDELFKELAKSRSKYRDVLKRWLLLGMITGLRPHEWSQAEIVRTNPDTGGPGIFLQVKNGKHTNGRGNGEYRHIDIGDYPSSAVQDISSFSSYMKEVEDRGEYRSLYGACQVLLCRTNIALGNDGKRIQLYSPRHRFSSEVKKVMSPEEVAALMGHATNKTAGMHYGKARHAKGGIVPKPIEGQVKTVRRVQNFAFMNLYKAGAIIRK